MSGVWVRCPNCDLEIKVEYMLRHGGIEPDLTLLSDHARNCEENKRS